MATAATKANGTKKVSAATDEESGFGLQRLIEGLAQNEKSALDAVKRFVDSVNEAFPDISENGPRQQIIDAAFRMTGQIVDASNQLALNLVDVTEKTLEDLSGSTEDAST